MSRGQIHFTVKTLNLFGSQYLNRRIKKITFKDAIVKTFYFNLKWGMAI